MGDTRPLSVRAVASGTCLGGLLSICNLYMGLRVGWSINMSVLAALLGFILCRGVSSLHSHRPWCAKESNLQQTAASAAGGTVSAGLVAPIPAYLMLTGDSLELMPLFAWMSVISLLGVVVASAMRPAMLRNQRLRFPTGLATAGVIQDLYSNSRRAGQRMAAMGVAMAVAIGHRLMIPTGAKISLGFSLPGKGTLSGSSISAKNLGFIIEPSYMLLGIGALIGPRAGLSLMLGSLLAWLGLGPAILANGWKQPGPEEAVWFGLLLEWLLWPGVALMVGASLANTLVTMVRQGAGHRLALRWGRFELGLLLLVTPAVVLLQVLLFNISLFAALLAVPLALVFAVIAAQVVGQTGIPPVGALGKLSQLTYAFVSPGQLTTNLMTGNVAGGAAGQATDLLNDFRAGQILGTQPRHQLIAQCCGILSGCLVSSAVFLLLFPDPANQLLTEQWPAPGVAAWSAVATALTSGLSVVPAHAVVAMLLGLALGLLMESLSLLLPERLQRWLPSASALGMGFVIPASVSLMLFTGAVAALLLRGLAPGWSRCFLLAIAAGFIAGESLAGVLGTLVALF